MQANVVNDKIYVVGGSSFNTQNAMFDVYDTTEVYDPQSNSWFTAAPVPNPISGYASAVADNKIYVIGGIKLPSSGSSDSAFDTNLIYDPAPDKWTSGAPIPVAVGGAVAVETTGVMAPEGIYVFGGSTKNGSPSYLNQVYNPKTNSWTNGTELIGIHYDSAVVNVNDTLYVIGGEYSEFVGGEQSSIQIFNPPPPFHASNNQYIPFGYGTFSPIPTASNPSPAQSPISTVSPSSPSKILSNEAGDYAALIVIVALIVVACMVGVAPAIKRGKRQRSSNQH